MRIRKLRIALYSHDTMGMGHMRRNFLLAQTLTAPPIGANVLMIAGAHEVNAFSVPAGADCLTLPAMRKGADGQYHPRSLDIPLPQLITLRAHTIRAAVEAFEPDLLIVDKVPRGAFDELDPALRCLRRRGRTRCVLGLRDVLDDPETVHREWSEAQNVSAIHEFYDAVWIYGDPTVYDLLREYDMPTDVAEKARFTGYLDSRMRLQHARAQEAEVLTSLALPSDQVVLCQVGGGQDGAHVADAFCNARFPAGTTGVLLTGPFMAAELRQQLHQRAAVSPHLRVLDFASEPTHLLSRADRVIAMGGYNTVCEVLSFEKPALIVPRTTPRREQLIRAERLRDLGAVDMLHPDEITPSRLGEWLGGEARCATRVHDQIDFNGLARLPDFVDELVSGASRAILN